MNNPAKAAFPAIPPRGAYQKGQEFVIHKKNQEEEFLRNLRIKSQKIEAWWHERGRHYLGKYRFVGLTLTFRDEEAYAEFEKWGGRRAFINHYKMLCKYRFGRDVIVDYLCVAEFQQRGVIHYHFLVVCEFGYKLPYPDEVFKWGHTNLVVLNAKTAKEYLTRYVRKMRQLDYKAYQQWKSKFGRFRLYEFSRKLPNGILGLMNKGWGRVLYWRVLKNADKSLWFYNSRDGKLYLRYGDMFCGVEAIWSFLFLDDRIYLKFWGFKITVSVDFSFFIDSLDELIEFVRELFTRED